MATLGFSKLLSKILKKSSPGLPSRLELECCICREGLFGKVIHDSWGNSAHLGHPIAFCNSCDRILSPKGSGGAFKYSDGRFICGYCKKMAITEGVEANRSRRKVQSLLESKGFQGIPKNINVVLAHSQVLSNHSRKSRTAGLTLSHYHFADYKRVGITHQIGILFGLPKVEFEGVLAHELLHVWQHENGIKFSPSYREGLCELGSYLIYSEDSSELARHLLKKMFESKDPVYGIGFRIMLKKLEQWNWKRLQNEIIKNKHGFEESIMKKIFSKK